MAKVIKRFNETSSERLNSEPNPFIYQLHATNVDKFVWLLMMVTLAPLKITFGFVSLVFAWVPARLSVIGLPLQPDKPLSNWRLVLKDIATFFANTTGYIGGLAPRTVKGVRASSKDATLLVVAPHTAFLDVMVGVMCGMPGVVSLLENASLPLLGALFRANQTIFLDKKDPLSRNKTAEAIRTRARSNGAWPQLLIYPEGMIGNGSALLPFKIGAFQPGVPIQPVTVKYPNRLDVTTWLDTGPSLLAMISLWICTPVTKMEVEYHPVYNPSDEEKANPKLFAENVRSLMSQLYKYL
ncbi:lysophospholipid acyltransferase LPCAT4-like isoform X2 [Watersipora subatra]|uniref:lysophospholipid acyltransferase LPCAT4-like isoform X2 n=1 Tax=Watersipora subatra TaxID=2589382 RepID=UPI00355B6E2E